MTNSPTRKTALGLLGLAVLVAGCSAGAGRVNQAALRASQKIDLDKKLIAERWPELSRETSDYQIGAGDVIEVSVFQWEVLDETRTVTAEVSQKGTVSLLLIGEISVKDKTTDEAKNAVANALVKGKFLRDPQVAVSVKEFRSKRVAVVGAVKQPGTYTLRQNVTRLLDILGLAGGRDDTAGQYLYIVRSRKQGGRPGEKQVIRVDLHELLVKGHLELNAVLSDGDVVNVPPADKFYVAGYVKNPGAYDLKRPTGILMAIAMAGGVERPGASPSACVLKRGEEEIPIDLVAIADGDEPDMSLQANDTIQVGQTFLRGVALALWDGVRNLLNFGVSVGR